MITVHDTDSISDTGQGSEVTKSFTYDIGDAILIILADRDNVGGISSISPSGSNVTFADCGQGKKTSSRCHLQVFEGLPTGSGSGTFTVNFADTCDSTNVHVVQLRSATGEIARDVGNSAVGTSTNPSTTITTTEADTKIIAPVARASTSTDITDAHGYDTVVAHSTIGAGGNASTLITLGEDKAATGSETAQATLSGSFNWAIIALAYYEVDSGGQTVSPNLLTNANTVYSPTVTLPQLLVEPNLLVNTNVVESPTVTIPQLLVEPNLLVNTNVVESPTVSLSTTVIEPDFLINVNTVEVPTVTKTQLLVEPSLLINVNTIESPTVTLPQLLVEPDLLVNTNTIESPTVTTSQTTIFPDLLINVNTVEDPTVTQTQLLVEPDLLVNTNVVESPTVTIPQLLVEPDTLVNTTVVYPPTILTGQTTIFPELLVNANIVESPTVSQTQLLVEPDLLVNTPVIYVPIVSIPQVVVEPDTLVNVSVIYSPTVSVPGSGSTIDVPLLVNTNVFFRPIVISMTGMNVETFVFNLDPDANTFVIKPDRVYVVKKDQNIFEVN